MSQCEKGAIFRAITSHHTHIWVLVHVHMHTHTHTRSNAAHVSELFCGSPRKEMSLLLSVGVIICGGEMIMFLIVILKLQLT